MSFDLTFPFVSRHRLLILLGTACIFAVAHTQAPLYFSNQNQYFLHGAAAAGKGHSVLTGLHKPSTQLPCLAAWWNGSTDISTNSSFT